MTIRDDLCKEWLRLAAARHRREAIILCNGCMDPAHYGHVLHLREAAKYGRVMVAVTSDKQLRKERGRAPFFTAKQRIDMLMELRCVAYAFETNSSLSALKKVRPHYFVKGVDYKGKIDPRDAAFCKEHGIRIIITRTKKWGSRELMRKLGAR